MNQKSESHVFCGHTSERSIKMLNRSRTNLRHLIYSMEHDRSLDAETTRIEALRGMLISIEQQLKTGFVHSGQPVANRQWM
jgi:hypothetical protein